MPAKLKKGKLLILKASLPLDNADISLLASKYKKRRRLCRDVMEQDREVKDREQAGD